MRRIEDTGSDVGIDYRLSPSDGGQAYKEAMGSCARLCNFTLSPYEGTCYGKYPGKHKTGGSEPADCVAVDVSMTFPCHLTTRTRSS